MININDDGIALSEGTVNIIDEIEDNFNFVTKNDYALTRLKDGCNVEHIETEWYKISKGHNFVFKIADNYISVDYLDRILK